ncbi:MULTISPECIES: hypothetical protein [Paenibacillus]|uniref:Uncharacterized protein n=1 Tax=Paenibacillus naphthalenovorans TaxID=162209 RepID=A0A0U2W1L8_9BACL|nr:MULTISPECIES: hypothetical protein [Paenibacillus]ALS21277.1 hypothetical protein IJ22_08950 [Paenibacillus naphthalenovorans]NTZ18558.1 hypothetical protein [Paenibacillus sp. JMULE4]GCL72533.1 hypothetical protein PN4B1_24600 [Paenibacillus naphthalenovorans]SDH98264.1 hypothetical protein SAMN05421868_102121 [Paenibacillus naphthalenovorans]
MRGNAFVKYGTFGLAMAFCIFFGVSLATQGTERIHGPLTKAQADAAPAQRAYSSAPAAGKTAAAGSHTAKSKPPVKSKAATDAEPTADTGINRVGNKAGELLQIAAYHAIRAFVSLIEALLK